MKIFIKNLCGKSSLHFVFRGFGLTFFSLSASSSHDCPWLSSNMSMWPSMHAKQMHLQFRAVAEVQHVNGHGYFMFYTIPGLSLGARRAGNGLVKGIFEERPGWDNGHSINAKRWTSTLWLIVFAGLWTGIAEKFIKKFEFLRSSSSYRLPFITRRSLLIDLRPLGCWRGAISLACDFLPLQSEHWTKCTQNFNGIRHFGNSTMKTPRLLPESFALFRTLSSKGISIERPKHCSFICKLYWNNFIDWFSMTFSAQSAAKSSSKGF